MQTVKTFILILIVLSCFCSCRQHSLIDAKTKERDSVLRLITFDNDQIAKNAKSTDSLSGLREKQYQFIELLKDSLNTVVNESPMASEVIYAFDKQPIQMLKDYVSQKTDSAKNNWLGSRLLMIAYTSFDFNQETMRIVRAQMNRFDSETRACRSVISGLDEQIEKNNAQTGQYKLEVSRLTESSEQLEKEIEELNKQGII